MRGDPIHPDWLSWWQKRQLAHAARKRRRAGGLSAAWTRREPGEHLIFDGLPWDAPWVHRPHVPGSYILTVVPGSVVVDRKGAKWVVTRTDEYTDAVRAGFSVSPMMMGHIRVFARRVR